MHVFSWLCLALAFAGAVMLLIIFAAWGYIVATGGLYGSGSYTGVTLENAAFGSAIVFAGALPMMLTGLLALVHWRKRTVPNWLRAACWSATAGILVFVTLDLLTASSPKDFGLLTFPVLPFTIGLFGFLVSNELQGTR